MPPTPLPSSDRAANAAAITLRPSLAPFKSERAESGKGAPKSDRERGRPNSIRFNECSSECDEGDASDVRAEAAVAATDGTGGDNGVVAVAKGSIGAEFKDAGGFESTAGGGTTLIGIMTERRRLDRVSIEPCEGETDGDLPPPPLEPSGMARRWDDALGGFDAERKFSGDGLNAATDCACVALVVALESAAAALGIDCICSLRRSRSESGAAAPAEPGNPLAPTAPSSNGAGVLAGQTEGESRPNDRSTWSFMSLAASRAEEKETRREREKV